jgi:hypothetical protein
VVDEVCPTGAMPSSSQGQLGVDPADVRDVGHAVGQVPPWGWVLLDVLCLRGFGLSCRLRVLLSGASIDGSPLYGDLPALDGAETTDIAEALVSEFESALQHPKGPGFRVGVVSAHVGVGCSRGRAIGVLVVLAAA